MFTKYTDKVKGMHQPCLDFVHLSIQAAYSPSSVTITLKIFVFNRCMTNLIMLNKFRLSYPLINSFFSEIFNGRLYCYFIIILNVFFIQNQQLLLVYCFSRYDACTCNVLDHYLHKCSSWHAISLTCFSYHLHIS